MAEQVFCGTVITPTKQIPNAAVKIRGSIITEVGSEGEVLADFSGPVHRAEYILPGLVDIHCHGGGGQSFPDATTPAEAQIAIDEHRAHGTTTLVASTVTAAPQTLRERTANLRQACDAGELDGIHWEGPFISQARCGAQDPELIIAPDAPLTAQLCEIAGPFATTMTLAPEAPGVNAVVETLITRGALPSFGHTDAGPQAVLEALTFAEGVFARSASVRARRATVTHLFNGMRPLHHRDPGPIMPLLRAAAAGEVVVELIADGEHVDRQLVLQVIELVGRENCVFVTDAMAAAGMADGQYRLGSMDVTVADGCARLTDSGNLAGGTSHLLDQVRGMHQVGLDLVDACYLAATSPAHAIGRSDVGAIARGYYADLVLCDSALTPTAVVRRGEEV